MEYIAVNTIAIIFQTQAIDGSHLQTLKCMTKKCLDGQVDMGMERELKFVH